MSTKNLIVLMGLPLTGKSSVGNILVKHGYHFLDVDEARRIVDPAHDPALPRDEDHEKEVMIEAYKHIHSQAQYLLSQGKKVVLAATYSRPLYHKMVESLSKATIVKPLLVLLTSTDKTIEGRLATRRGENSLSNIRTIVDYLNIKSRYVIINQPYQNIATDKLTTTQIALKILRI